MLNCGTKQKWLIHLSLTLFLLVNIWFVMIERSIRIPTHYMYSRIDDFIPFIPHFIVPYYIWYLYQAIPMIWFYFTSAESFQKIMVFSVLSFTAACITYMIYPNGIQLRAGIFQDDIFTNWVAFTYSKDSPVNSAPSLHVLMSIGMHLSIADNEKLRRYPWLIKASRILMILICMSTVFVKQHSIIDVTLGCVIGYLLYLLVYRRKKSFRKSLATEF